MRLTAPEWRGQLLTALLAAALLAGAPVASTSDPMQEIRAAAIAALGAEPGEAEVTLDSSLRLHRCSQPLQAAASGPHTAVVRCADSPGWRLYVPVRIRRQVDVVVLTAPVTAGVPIVARQLTVQRREMGAQMPSFSAPALLVGRIPRRPLAAGVAPTENDLAVGAPLRRGDPVELVARVDGVEVRMQGRALGPAQVGGRISVENTASHRILRGRVVEDGVVEMVP